MSGSKKTIADIRGLSTMGSAAEVPNARRSDTHRPLETRSVMTGELQRAEAGSDVSKRPGASSVMAES